jgi:hypothetical protein
MIALYSTTKGAGSMTEPTRLLMQTTILGEGNNWHIGRFSLLRDHLAALCDESGAPLFEVTARDRASIESNDPVLASLDQSDFNQLWLFAVDTGDGLTTDECAAIGRFHARGGGLLTTRDHQDLGSSLCSLGGVGAAHHFHTHNPEMDQTRCCRDDRETENIDWPNYHSGRNGDYQRIMIVEPAHELWRRADASLIEYLPAHPHEGAVDAPPSEKRARVIAKGRSRATAREFNLVVAFEREPGGRGRAVAESSFHHFVDYNWDPERGCPDFVEEAPGDGYRRNPGALDDIRAYVSNLARWLRPER